MYGSAKKEARSEIADSGGTIALNSSRINFPDEFVRPFCTPPLPFEVPWTTPVPAPELQLTPLDPVPGFGLSRG